MNYKDTLVSSLKSALTILKLVIPIFIIADILYFYNLLSYIAFLVEPFTSILGLPVEASLSIISGMFLNLYAAVAFAAPLDLTPHQWTTLALFLGVCHSLIVESVIMKKIGLSNRYSFMLRIVSGLIVAFIAMNLPSSWFSATLSDQVFEKTTYDTIENLLIGSFGNAIILSFKIIILITALIFVMDFIKSRKFMKDSAKNISKGFSITVGLFLGITYGGGILIKEADSGSISKENIFFVGTFLMICHAIIEDTLLFVIFGADFTMVVIIRTLAAIIISYIMQKVYLKRKLI